MVYLDVLFLVNFVTSALFLLGSGLLCGIDAHGPRILAGAFMGAAASFILLAPELPWPLSLVYQLATGAGIVAAAYPWPGKRCFLRLLAWFWALHLALTGALLLPGAQTNNFSVYLPLSPGLLLLCAGGVYLAVQGILRVFGRQNLPCFSAELTLGETSIPLRAFCDTGFSVQEPLSGRDVVLVRLAAVRGKLPPTLEHYLTDHFSGTASLPPPEARVRLVPCSTIAGHCVLPAVPAKLSGHAVYAAFCDLPPPPEGWDILAGEAVVSRLELSQFERSTS